MGHKNTEPSESLVIRLIMVEQLVCLSKAGVGYVGVNLGCSDRCMSEKFLNDTDISAISKECRCKGMPESMG